MIKFENVSKKYDDKIILDNVSFTVADSETLAIIGFSGTGKSTVLRIISKLTEADSGNIILSNDDIGMVFQYSALFDSLNIYENVAFAYHERPDLKKEYKESQLKQIVAENLRMVGLQNIEDLYPSELSGGMQKRVSFARAIITRPSIMLYDEPTAGLDPVSSTVIEDYIVRLKNELKTSSIVVTHQMSTITRTADRVIMLYQGKIVWEGTPQELLKADNPYTHQFVYATKEGPMTTSA
ncbi:MAG TPA: ATP-binding cassette domain-containing protein [Candidatus Adamsella sp.]|nr:ATP-binding cassette domain-containing protein [Candidatus Adamsella sp.]